MTEELTRVDSAVAGLSISPKDEKTQTKTVEKEKKTKTHKRTPSKAEGVRNINDLGGYPFYHCIDINVALSSDLSRLEKDKIPIEIAIETQKLNWRVLSFPCVVHGP